MAAALGQYRARSVVPLLTLFKRGLSPRDTLAFVVQGTTADHGLPAGCFFTKLRLTGRALGDATKLLVGQIEEERRSTFEEWFRIVDESGLLNPALTPPQAARYLDAQLTLILVRLAANDPVVAIREDANLALGALLV